MSLEKYNILYYCSTCGGILLQYEEDMIEYITYTRYWTEDGMLENGEESDYYDVEVKRDSYPVCNICKNETKLKVTLKAALLLQILKYSYRDKPGEKWSAPDKIFKIELKHKTEYEMFPPTLQEIKEAIVEDAV